MKIKIEDIEKRIGEKLLEYGFQCYCQVNEIGSISYTYHQYLNGCYIVIGNDIMTERNTNRIIYYSLRFSIYNAKFMELYKHYIRLAGYNEHNTMNAHLILGSYSMSSYTYNEKFNLYIDNEATLSEVILKIDEILINDLTEMVKLGKDFDNFLRFCQENQYKDVLNKLGDTFIRIPLIYGLIDKTVVEKIKGEYLNRKYAGKWPEGDSDYYYNFLQLILRDDYSSDQIMVDDNKDYTKPEAWFENKKFVSCKSLDSQSIRKVNTTSINEEFFSLYIIQDNESVLHNKLLEQVKADAEKCFLSELAEDQQNIWVGRYHNVTIVVGNHDDDELVDTINSEPENEICDTIMSSIENGKALFLHVYQSYNIMCYIIEKGEKRIRMMYVHPDIAKMEGAFTPEEKALFTPESNKYNSIDRIFNLHLKGLTGLSTINDQSLSDVEMVKIELY